MFNEATLIGHLGQDPQVKSLQGEDDEFVIASLATTRTWKNSEGAKEQAVEWHRLVFFRNLARIAREHLKKGALIWVRGPLRTRKWEDEGGVEHASTQIVVRDLRMLGKPAAKGEQAAGEDAPDGGAAEDADVFPGE